MIKIICAVFDSRYYNRVRFFDQKFRINRTKCCMVWTFIFGSHLEYICLTFVIFQIKNSTKIDEQLVGKSHWKYFNEHAHFGAQRCFNSCQYERKPFWFAHRWSTMRYLKKKLMKSNVLILIVWKIPIKKRPDGFYFALLFLSWCWGGRLEISANKNLQKFIHCTNVQICRLVLCVCVYFRLDKQDWMRLQTE